MIEDEDDTMVEDNVATNATALGTQGGEPFLNSFWKLKHLTIIEDG